MKGGVVFFNENNQFEKLDLHKHLDNFLLITNQKNLCLKNLINNQVVSAPTSPNQIKNQIEKFISSQKIVFENIEIKDKKLTNVLNKKSCLLTEVEKDIVIYLIISSSSSKEYIKQNILKINSSVETNSLDSHLTRIRKKIEKVDEKIKIQSKQDKLIFFIDQKK